MNPEGPARTPWPGNRESVYDVHLCPRCAARTPAHSLHCPELRLAPGWSGRDYAREQIRARLREDDDQDDMTDVAGFTERALARVRTAIW
jgi:hypothetical protein